MKTLLSFFLVLSLLIPIPSWAVIALDQSTAQETVVLVATTETLSFGTLPAVGSTVVGCVTGADFSGNDIDFMVGVGDNQGNGAYSILKKAPASGGNASAMAFWKENVASSGTFTLTFTATNSTLIAITWGALSFTGVVKTPPADQANTGGVDGAATSLSITTSATVQANELVLACLGTIHDGADTDVNMVQNTAGYTNFLIHENNATFPGAMGDYKIISTVGTQNTNWSFDTTTAAGSTAGVIQTFKAAGGCISAMGLMGVGSC